MKKCKRLLKFIVFVLWKIALEEYKNLSRKNDSFEISTMCAKISPYISLNLRQDLLQSYERKEWQKLIVMLLSIMIKLIKPDKIDLELNTDDILKAKEELLDHFKAQLLFNIR